MDENVLIGMLFSGGTALAGLILVFLGLVLNAYDSYDTVAKQAVRAKYKRRARVGLAGFVFAMTAAIFSLAANWFLPFWFVAISMACLAGSFLLVFIAAIQAVGDIS